jgi:HEAT repeat protein
VEKYLAHPDAEVRAKAAIATSRLADAAGWEKLLALRGDPDELVRAAVSEGLGNWTSARG